MAETLRCAKCGGPKASTIHQTGHPNTEIRMAAHMFEPLSRDWCEKMGAKDDGQSVEAGRESHPPVQQAGEKCPTCGSTIRYQRAEATIHPELTCADKWHWQKAQQPAPLTIDVEYHKERERRAWAKHCNDQPAPTPAASAKVCLPPQRSVEQYEEIAWVREFADKNKFALESDYFSPTMAMLLREYHAQASAGLRAERDDLKRRFEATMEIQAALAGKEMDMYRDLGLEQGPDGSWHNERAEKAESEVRELRERLKAVQKDAK